jgi:hypothetical protein
MKSESNSFGDADDFVALTLYGKRSPVVEVLVSSYQAYPQGDNYSVNGTCGGLVGGAEGLKWRYFDPAKAPTQALMTGWSDSRGYCKESLPWVEETWQPPKMDIDVYQFIAKSFYNNLYDVLTGKDKLVVTPEQVRRQVAVIEECHRQNRLPRLDKKFSKE